MRKRPPESMRLYAAADDEAHKAQEERSKKYGIAVREGGHVTKPGQWKDVPDDEWLDPVNYAYPCPDAEQTRAAASYWGKAKNKEEYSEADRKKLDGRLERFEKKFKIGEHKETPAKAAAVREMSHEEVRDLLQGKLPDDHYVQEVHDDHIIVHQYKTAEYYKFPWSVTAEGDDVVLGSPVKVEPQWVDCKSATRILAAADDPESADYGYRWRVQVHEGGLDKQGGIDYEPQAVKSAAPIYEGARVFALTQGQHEHPTNPFGKSVRDLVGWLSGVKPNDTGLEGTLNVLKSAKWLRDMLVDSFERGKPDLVGLSHDARGEGTVDRTTGRKNVKRITRVDSVDVVYNPIGGGKFLKMAAAGKAGQEEAEMEMLEKLLAALKEKRPQVYATIEAKVKDKTVTADEVIALMAADANAAVAPAAAPGEAEKILKEMKLSACGITLKDELRESKLPELSQARIKKQFDGTVFETAALQAAIKDEKEYLDKLMASGTIMGAGRTRLGVGIEEPERIQAALDKLFGVKVDDKFKDVKPLPGLRAAYTMFMGDENVSGMPTMDADRQSLNAAFTEYMHLPAAFSTSSFSFALGNTLYRRLIQDYKAVEYHEEDLISYKRNARDFKTMESIRVGYFSDLPDVNPEVLDYQEITMVDDEEVHYQLNQKGIILSVTRKAVINDDLRTVVQLVGRLGRAAKRTFARRGWNLLINNAIYGADGLNIFHNTHGNLGVTQITNDATGIATLTSMMTAMYNMTEKDSGEVLALSAEWEFVPRSLLEIAHALNQPWPMGGIFNPHAGQFGNNNEKIDAVPFITDGSVYHVGDKNETELLEVAFLNGLEQPELFVADNPLVGQMFVGDRIQYKMRHEYEFIAADYRGFYKALHA